MTYLQRNQTMFDDVTVRITNCNSIVRQAVENNNKFDRKRNYDNFIFDRACQIC
jgi:hypothetical protein